MATGCELEGQGLIPGTGKVFLYIHLRPDRLWSPSREWVLRALSLEVKRPGRETGHSPPPP
jgi:hypothetical protein